MRALSSFVELGHASRVSDANWKEEEASSRSQKTHYALYEHLQTLTNYLEMYGKMSKYSWMNLVLLSENSSPHK